MKRLFLIILLAGIPLFAQHESIIDEGNELYKSGDFEGAAQKYLQVINEGYESPVLYYNLGNAYFRLNDLGKAILYYEKGLKLSPGNEDIEYNLEIAQARTVDKIEEVPQIFIVRWWDSVVVMFSVNGWGMVFVLFFILTVVAAGMFFASKSVGLQKTGFWTGAIGILFLLICGIFLFTAYTRESKSVEGVLLAKTENAKVSPDASSSDAFIIHEGIKFRIRDNVDTWSRIELSDGTTGWIPETSYGEI